VEFLFNGILGNTAQGAGLSTLSGLRAFLPLALAGLLARTEVLGDTFDLDGSSFAFLESSWAIVIFATIALLELTADKVPLLDTAQDLLATPLRVLAGAVLFGAALADQQTAVVVAGLVGGGVIAGAAHAVKGVIRPGATIATGGAVNPFLSLFEDVAAALGTVILILLPILGALLLLFLLLLIFGIGRRRKRKYKGLRILRD
jgi:uncharacterized membrane protein